MSQPYRTDKNGRVTTYEQTLDQLKTLEQQFRELVQELSKHRDFKHIASGNRQQVIESVKQACESSAEEWFYIPDFTGNIPGPYRLASELDNEESDDDNTFIIIPE